MLSICGEMLLLCETLFFLWRILELMGGDGENLLNMVIELLILKFSTCALLLIYGFLEVQFGVAVASVAML